MKKIFKTIAILKNYTSRTMNYFTIVQGFLIILTFKKIYDIEISSVYIIMIGIALLIIIGTIDYKFIFPYEFKHINSKNDIKQDLKEIKEMLKKNE